MNLAYLIGTRSRPSLDRDIEAGRHPCPEYVLFLKRNPGLLFGPDSLPESARPIADALRPFGLVSLGLPWVVDHHTPQVDVIVAGSEECGLPLARYSSFYQTCQAIYIITHGLLLDSPVGIAPLLNNPFVHLLCLSDSIRRLILADHPDAEARVLNVGWGVDTKFFTPTCKRSGSPLIVSAGAANRDYVTLIKAVTPLQTATRIAADSAWRSKPVAFPQMVLPDHVKIRSYRTYLRLRSLYNRASFVVVPPFAIPARLWLRRNCRSDGDG